MSYWSSVCLLWRKVYLGLLLIFWFIPFINWAARAASHVMLVVNNLPANAGDVRDGGVIVGSGRSPGGGHGNPLQYAWLENPMDRGAWQATVHRVTKSWTWLRWLNTHECMSCLYILEINPLLVALVGNIFSHSVGYLFVFFMVSFAVQKLLSLIRPHLFTFVFIFITLGGGLKKILLWFMSKSILLMFSSKGFIEFSLTFKYLIHLEFIFVYGVREYSNFIQFMCNCSVFPALIIEKTPLYILASFVID